MSNRDCFCTQIGLKCTKTFRSTVPWKECDIKKCSIWAAGLGWSGAAVTKASLTSSLLVMRMLEKPRIQIIAHKSELGKETVTAKLIVQEEIKRTRRMALLALNCEQKDSKLRKWTMIHRWPRSCKHLSKKNNYSKIWNFGPILSMTGARRHYGSNAYWKYYKSRPSMYQKTIILDESKNMHFKTNACTQIWRRAFTIHIRFRAKVENICNRN